MIGWKNADLLSNDSYGKSVALAELESAWKASESESIKLDPSIESKITQIISGHNLTYRYILVTGILGKLVNPNIHPRALQKGSKLQGAYDARSLCHKVVVPFEHSKGDLWGLSNEPFVNKPARHPELDKNNPQLRDKAGASLTHDVLEWANSVQMQELRKTLIFIMKLAKIRLASIPQVNPKQQRNLNEVRHFIREFLLKADGGTRLVAIVGAFVDLMNPDSDVRVYSPNVPDRFAKTSGDIELYIDGILVSAFECKDRPFTSTDISHGIKKAAENQVLEYVFVSGLNSTHPSEDAEKVGRKIGIDACWISIGDVIDCWTLALNTKRRAFFGKTVINILLQMRREEVAKIAAMLWKQCTEKTT